MTYEKIFNIETGGSVVKNPPANAGILSLVWEDPTGHRATKPERCNC